MWNSASGLPAPADGQCILVDRVWPRGISKERAELDAWLRDLAPSDELRQWYHAHPDHWTSFRKRYLEELAEERPGNALKELYRIAGNARRLTLLYASKEVQHNNAIVLKDLLEGMRKPPTGTGPTAARSGRERQVKRMPRP